MDKDSPPVSQISKTFDASLPHLFWIERVRFLRRQSSKVFYFFFLGIPFIIYALGLIPSATFFQPLFAKVSNQLLLASGLLYAFVVFPMIQYTMLWRDQNKPNHRVAPFHYFISRNGLGFSETGGTVEFDWQAVTKVTETKSAFLFYIKKRLAYQWPKSLLSSAEKMQLRAIIEEKVIS